MVGLKRFRGVFWGGGFREGDGGRESPGREILDITEPEKITVERKKGDRGQTRKRRVDPPPGTEERG